MISIAICTYCSKEKQETPGVLPAGERYKSKRIKEIQQLASAKGRPFLILSGKYGLLDSGSPIPFYDHLLQKEEVEWLIKKVSKQLSALNIKQLDYYTISHNQDPNLTPYLDCIQGAAELVKTSINIHFISKNIDA